MKLENIEFQKLLPQFMQQDRAVIGLSCGTNEIIKSLHQKASLLTTWDKLDKLSEQELDMLADELYITWYNKMADVEIKREIIKNSDMVYRKLGTRWAVENVIFSYFGDAILQEWFEYSGEPGHFKIISSNPLISNEKFEQFFDVLHKIKRGSAHLDCILISLTGHMKLHTGITYHETSFEKFDITEKFETNPIKPTMLHTGIVYYEQSFENIKIDMEG